MTTNGRLCTDGAGRTKLDKRTLVDGRLWMDEAERIEPNRRTSNKIVTNEIRHQMKADDNGQQLQHTTTLQHNPFLQALQRWCV